MARTKRLPVSFGFHRHPTTGAHGCIVGLVPWGGVIGYGDSKADALHTAAGIAADLHGVLQEHPELQAVLPPGTALGLQAISAASKALASGHTIDDVRRVVGPSTARVVGRLLSLF